MPVVRICVEFSKRCCVDVIYSSHECGVSRDRILITIDYCLLLLVFANAEESAAESKKCYHKDSHKIINVTQNLENDLHEGSNLIDESQKVKTFRQNSDDAQRFIHSHGDD